MFEMFDIFSMFNILRSNFYWEMMCIKSKTTSKWGKKLLQIGAVWTKQVDVKQIDL